VFVAAGLLTIGETARVTHLSKSSVRRLVARGELDAVRLGERSVRIWAASVTALLAREYRPRQAESEAA
jgi:excisionase family DNA binding protein